MDKNNTREQLSFSDALKVYTGMGMPGTLLRLFITAFAMLAFTVLFCYGIGLLIKKGDIAAVKDLAKESPTFDIIIGMICSNTTAALCYQSFEKNAPGGKYFRTVKGGFDTYKKVRSALIIQVFALIIFFYGLAALGSLVNILGFHYGANSCVSAALFLVLAFEIANLCVMIESQSLRALLITGICVSLPAVGVTLLSMTGGKLGLIHIITGALDLILLFVSNHVMLSQYKKNRWSN